MEITDGGRAEGRAWGTVGRAGGSRAASDGGGGCAQCSPTTQWPSLKLRATFMRWQPQRRSSRPESRKTWPGPGIKRQCEEVKGSKAKGGEGCSLLPQLFLPSHRGGDGSGLQRGPQGLTPQDAGPQLEEALLTRRVPFLSRVTVTSGDTDTVSSF